MLIIDNIIWNNVWEADLLWLKLITEHSKIDEFIVSQCFYDYHGRFKGNTLEPVLQEKRFQPFLNKIRTISIENNLSSSPAEEHLLDPPAYGNAEHSLRNAAHNYIVNKFSDEDRVFISDVDEIIDFEDSDKCNKLMGELNTDDKIQFSRIRMWQGWDFLSFRSPADMITPSYKVKHLKSGQATLKDKKWNGRIVLNNDLPCIIEYCTCFSKDGYYAKMQSSLHSLWDLKKIDVAIETATWHKTSYEGWPSPQCRYDWFEKVPLHKKNSIKYVRENLDKLCPNLSPDNYKENRIKYFGISPEFIENKDGNYD